MRSPRELRSTNAVGDVPLEAFLGARRGTLAPPHRLGALLSRDDAKKAARRGVRAGDAKVTVRGKHPEGKLFENSLLFVQQAAISFNRCQAGRSRQVKGDHPYSLQRERVDLP